MTDKEEIQEILQELNHCTKPGAGISRFTYSPEYKTAAALIKKRMSSLGLSVREDGVGTVYGRWEGADASLSPIMAGSHLDTVPQGGEYDGAAGIACALAAVSSLKKEGYIPHRPIEIVAFAEEEGTRWSDSMFSSRYISGNFPADLWEQKDKDGITLSEALSEYGIEPKQKAVRQQVGCFLELHIEQGPILWQSKKQIGIVTSISGMKNIEITIKGKKGHAGTTPMNMRSDALCAAASLILDIRRLAQQHGSGTVATVGKIQVFPGGANVIPGQVNFTVDLRSDNADTLAALTEEILFCCRACPLTEDASVTFNEEPVILHEGLNKIIESSAQNLGFATQRLSSGAGHDSMVMADLCPTGMIFIPCRDGLSHCAEEYSTPDQLSAGADTLTAVIRDIASQKGAVLKL